MYCVSWGGVLCLHIYVYWSLGGVLGVTEVIERSLGIQCVCTGVTGVTERSRSSSVCIYWGNQWGSLRGYRGLQCVCIES